MSKITITKGDVKTTLKPRDEDQALIAETLTNIKETGIPTNEELDAFGDKLWDLLDVSKKNAPNVEAGKLVESTQNVVTNIKKFFREKNNDSALQEIAKKLKEGIVSKKDEKSIEVDADNIKETIMRVGQMFYDISKEMVNDSEFRNMLITIIDIIQNSYERAEDKTSDLDVKEAIKTDIKTKEIGGSGNIQDSENKEQTYSGTTQSTYSGSTMDQPNYNFSAQKNVTGTNTEQVVKEKVKQMKKYMELTEEEKDTILKKVSSALLRLKSYPEYRPLIQNFFKLYDDMVDIWTKIENKPILQEAYKESGSVIHDIRCFIERACGINLDKWIGYIKRLDKIRQDPAYISLRKDFEDLLCEQRYQNEEDIKKIFEKIKKDISDFNDKFENILDDLAHETKSIINNISSDPLLSDIRSGITNVIKDIFTDKHGKPTIEAAANSIVKLKNFFFPMIKHEFSFLHFPIIEIESKNYYFRIENFNLHLDHIIPDQLNIETDSKIAVDFDKMKRHGEINIRLLFDKITTSIKKLKFSMKKKTGIHYNDRGLVNIFFENAAIDFGFNVLLREDQVDKIKVSKIDVDLTGMKIDIIETKHEVIDSILTTVFLPVLRGKLKMSIEEALYDIIQSGIFARINEGLKEIESK